MEHALNVDVAIKFDTDTALLLQHLKHWTLKNLANKKHVHDGYCWSYDSLEALGDIFPYWSKRQLERVINNAVKYGLIIKGNYNATAYDRTCWYALTPDAYWFYPELAQEKYLELLFSTISPNGDLEFSKWRYQYPQTVTPIPNTDPYTDPKPPLPPKGKEEGFIKFWNLYPIKKGRASCRAKWKSKKLEAMTEEIVTKLKLQIEKDDEWLRGYIPHPTTYLNQERWHDEISKSKDAVLKLNPKKVTELAPLVIYSGFVNELNNMKKFKEIPFSFVVPTFEEWQRKNITGDAKVYARGLNAGSSE